MSRGDARNNVAQDDAGISDQQFSSSDLRGLYRNERENFQINAVRSGLWLAVFAYILFSITDIILIPDVSAHTIAVRFAIGIFVLILFEFAVLRSKNRDVLDSICAIAVVAGYALWLIFAAQTAYTENFSYYMVFGSIFMMGANLFFAFRFEISIVSSALILNCFFVSLFTLHYSWSYIICLGTFYISCFVFTSYLNWNLNLERYNVFLNALEAKKQQAEATERGQALLRLSRTDPLTNLNNRRAMDDILHKYWSDWVEHGKSFSLVLIDIDHFKKFNDHYGHLRGDYCLTLVAAALGNVVHQYGGSIGRHGGEEFIALAPVQHSEQIAAFGEAIRRTVEDLALPHQGRRDRTSVVTASVGVSTPRPGTDVKLEKILTEADRALYLAKASGRNSVKYFNISDIEESDLNDRVAKLLKEAIERNLVSIAFQPILNVRSGTVDTAEALMRLRMPDGTEVPPRFFVPIAEETGIILELQYWMIRTVCRKVLSQYEFLSVSINISHMELKTPGFVDSVATILDEAAIRPDRLIFEITERLDLERDSEILAHVQDLKRLGIRIWLDDFGTGYAGLSWLRLVDFDTVKIDQTFLRDCKTPKGRTMLGDISRLVRNCGPKILVEGVETAGQMAVLHELGIDQAQGFYIGIPRPVDQLFSTDSALQILQDEA
ncbi:putative bifunctional diguanylate cyclase/phosphodiesterase [Methylovirgula sp. 4M-Z18]|uniref:putative bifunctional diguanylate cyclase/phosphodiesterase n=1 Tax=Methylovirgula sp. 4M-Z18 TaxID=2293567 RepID=UPI000E2FBAEA|nr:EAL domain-containing protein [Methylovirgula sp. 4M-Z18]RFB79432.1 EAL domain-containing protein [Methylovirgula sp. 4M-Z18]